MLSRTDRKIIEGEEQVESFGVDEGEVCNRDGCSGIMWLPPVENCSCHISPPCNRCVNNGVVCKECGADPLDDGIVWTSEEEQKRNDAMERGDYLRDRAKDELD